MSHPMLSVMATRPARGAKTRQAIIDAAVSIMGEEGAAAVTPQHVAARAGVGRATVYRHWSDSAALVQAALEQVDFPPVAASEAPIKVRVASELGRLANELSSVQTRRVLSILLERSERLQTAEAMRARLVAAFVAHLDAAIREAVDAGELTAAPDPGEMFDRLVGPLWSRRMLRGETVDDGVIERIVDDAFEPWLARAAEIVRPT